MPVAFSIERLSGKNASSQYIARDTATNASTTVINSYTGLLHKRTLKVDARHSTIVGEKEGLYLVLKLVQPGHPVLPDVNLLSQGLMDFVRVEGLLKLSDEEVLAVVVPTYAGPLTLQGSKRGNHSTQRSG